eukprot:4859334-Prymnesium_polylepis.1
MGEQGALRAALRASRSEMDSGAPTALPPSARGPAVYITLDSPSPEPPLRKPSSRSSQPSR